MKAITRSCTVKAAPDGASGKAEPGGGQPGCAYHAASWISPSVKVQNARDLGSYDRPEYIHRALALVPWRLISSANSVYIGGVLALGLDLNGCPN